MPFLNHPCCCNTREVADEQVRDAASATRVHEGTSRHAKPVLAGSAHVFPGVDVGTEDVATWTLFSDALWVDFRLKFHLSLSGQQCHADRCVVFEALNTAKFLTRYGYFIPCALNMNMSIRLTKTLAIGTLLIYGASSYALQIKSEHAIVISNDTGAVLFEKAAGQPVPIASLTKLMTAMVVLDSKPDMNERIVINAADVDLLKHSKSLVPVGTTLPRKQVLQLALMSSENRAAAALARTYTGGYSAFLRAVNAKIKALGMTQTVIKEPTGLSPENMSSAADLAKMAIAASGYPDIVNITTHASDKFQMTRRSVTFHNTNQLVGAKGWDVRLSKTGFTNEAGHCLIMRIKQAGKQATLVLLNAKATAASRFDALNIRQLLDHRELAQVSMPTSRL